jgi:acyl carrier protein phosphodiesterase
LKEVLAMVLRAGFSLAQLAGNLVDDFVDGRIEVAFDILRMEIRTRER